MTCEVAVLNTRGIALAADSAVTLRAGGDRRKVYNTAEKLFCLDPRRPVGVMTFGSADLLAAPWETIIKAYANDRSPSFGALKEYVDDFLDYLQQFASVFSAAQQSDYVGRSVDALWTHYCDMVEGVTRPDESMRSKIAKLEDIVSADLDAFDRDPAYDNVDEHYAAAAMGDYEAALEGAFESTFGDVPVPPRVAKKLRAAAQMVIYKRCGGPFSSGVVFAGMGENEPFPSVIELGIGIVVGGRVQSAVADVARIDLECSARVMPFAQRDIIDMVISGMHPAMRRRLNDQLDIWAKAKQTAQRNSVRRFAKEIDAFIDERYEDPFMTAVSALPRQDLAKMADALVSLTAFVMRMSMDHDDTVAEPVDVAIISKGDGFRWVKHKEFARDSALL